MVPQNTSLGVESHVTAVGLTGILALETQNYTFDKNPTEITTYMSLQEFSFNINFYETSLEHGTAYGEIYIFSKTNFIDVYITMTTTALLFIIDFKTNFIDVYITMTTTAIFFLSLTLKRTQVHHWT